MRFSKASFKNFIADCTRQRFRLWLEEHCDSEDECWAVVRKGRPTDEPGVFWYLDAVEEALCFGWIDSIVRFEDKVAYQRFSPRRKRGNWTELNKERVRRLIKLGLMRPQGMKVLPKGFNRFRMDKEVEQALKDARVWSKFKRFPDLYRRIRSSNVAFYRKIDPAMYDTALSNLISYTKKGEMYGDWNDYGRLLSY